MGLRPYASSAGSHDEGSGPSSIVPSSTAPLLGGGIPASPHKQSQADVNPQILNPKPLSSQAFSKPAVANSSFASAAMAEAMYCFISAGTILFNKHALSTFQFPAPNSLLLFQFVVAVLLLKGLQAVGAIHLEPLRWDMVRIWFPANLIFVAMNITGFFALQHVGAGMFTVLKNMSNLMTIIGDWVIFGNTYSWQVWGCLGLMIASAMMGGLTDLHFSLEGFAWQMVNCVFTAAYSLYLRKSIKRLYAWQMVNCVFTAAYSLYLCNVIKRVSALPHQQFNSKRHLGELSMVYYNNILSVPPLAIMALASGDIYRLRGYQGFYNFEFQMVAVLGACMGFLLSFASIWCMARTSPTIYSLTGSLNKVIVAVIGMWFFKEKATLVNLASIAMGLCAGFLFVFAKSRGPSSGGASKSGSVPLATSPHAAGSGSGQNAEKNNGGMV
eukprot:gene362-1752_t